MFVFYKFNFMSFIQKINNKFFKFTALFIIVNLVYYFLYYYCLQKRISILGIAFFVLTLIFYISISNFTKNIYLRIIRLLLVAFLIFFNIINFIHFKNLKSFLVLGKGFVSGINKSEIFLLSGFLYQTPLILIISSVVLLIAFILFDLFTVKTKFNLKISFIVLLFSFLSIFFITFFSIKNPLPSWSSIEIYHSNFGPVGYLYPEIFKKIFSERGIINKTNSLNKENSSLLSDTRNALKELSDLGEKKSYTLPILPKFEKMPNIIFYQLESTSLWAINQNPTPMPFLKKLMQENITVDHFYGNDCHTIGSEFTSMCSFMPDSREIISSRIDPPKYECLASTLNQKFGYLTEAYHSNVSSFWNRDRLFPLWGIKKMYFTPYFKEKDSDEIVTKEILKNIAKNKSKPIFDYFISYTAHSPHTKDNINDQLVQNKLEIKPYPYQLNEIARAIDLEEEELRNYLGFLSAEDNAIQKMFEELEAKNELDNTIIVIFGDHRYYGFKNNSAEYLSEFNELPFVMYVPGMKFTKIPIVASHIDIAPSILDLISDVDIDLETQYIGQSIFSSDHNNQAIGKCGDEIFYFSPYITLGGNFALNIYNMTKKPTDLSIEKQKEYYTKLSRAVYYSDELVGYPEDFVFPSGSLLRGGSNLVYIIDNNKKRLIASEDIFYAMGFSWNDVRKISDEKLSEYETGKNLTLQDAYLAKNPMELLKNQGIFQNKAKNSQIIAHALGGIEKDSGTNSREAFIENYKNGIRFFEVDLSLTKDGNVVAFHEGNEFNIGLDKKLSEVTLEEFKKHKFFEKYTLLDFRDILDLMKEYKDAYIITDTGEDLGVLLSKIVSLSKNYYPQALDRIIPQIYHENDLKIVSDLFDFKDLIYTLYRTSDNDEKVLNFLKNNTSRITAVTMWWDKRFSENFKNNIQELGLKVFVHTINDNNTINKFIKEGVGVYSDFYPKIH